MSKPQWMTIMQTAKLLNVSRITVQRYIRLDMLICKQMFPGKRGSRVWINRTSAETLKERRNPNCVAKGRGNEATSQTGHR